MKRALGREIQNTGRTRFKAPTPEEAMRDNDRRLRLVRKHFGYIPLRFQAQTKISNDDKLAWKHGKAGIAQTNNGWNGWGLVRGFTMRIRLSEAIDVFDLLRDISAFVHAWRPWRARNPENEKAARAALATWQQLGG